MFRWLTGNKTAEVPPVANKVTATPPKPESQFHSDHLFGASAIELRATAAKLAAVVGTFAGISSPSGFDVVACAGAIFAQGPHTLSRVLFSNHPPSLVDVIKAREELTRIHKLLQDPLKWAIKELDVARKLNFSPGLLDDLMRNGMALQMVSPRQATLCKAALVMVGFLYQKVRYQDARLTELLRPIQETGELLDACASDQDARVLNMIARSWAVQRYHGKGVSVDGVSEAQLREGFIDEHASEPTLGRALVSLREDYLRISRWGLAPLWAHNLKTDSSLSYAPSRDALLESIRRLEETRVPETAIARIALNLRVTQQPHVIGLICSNPYVAELTKALRRHGIERIWPELVSAVSEGTELLVRIDDRSVPILPVLVEGTKSAARKSLVVAVIEQFDHLKRFGLLDAVAPLLLKGDTPTAVIRSMVGFARNGKTEVAREVAQHARRLCCGAVIDGETLSVRARNCLRQNFPRGISQDNAASGRSPDANGAPKPIPVIEAEKEVAPKALTVEFALTEAIQGYDKSDPLLAQRLREARRVSTALAETVRVLAEDSGVGGSAPWLALLRTGKLFGATLDLLQKNRRDSVRNFERILRGGTVDELCTLLASNVPTSSDSTIIEIPTRTTEFPIIVPQGKFDRIVIYGMRYSANAQTDIGKAAGEIEVWFPGWEAAESAEPAGLRANDLVVEVTTNCAHSLERRVRKYAESKGAVFMLLSYAGKRALMQIAAEVAERSNAKR